MKAKLFFHLHRICQSASQYFFDKLRGCPFDEMQYHQNVMCAMVEKELQQQRLH